MRCFEGWVFDQINKKSIMSCSLILLSSRTILLWDAVLMLTYLPLARFMKSNKACFRALTHGKGLNFRNGCGSFLVHENNIKVLEQ
jgi:hypothetical protein